MDHERMLIELYEKRAKMTEHEDIYIESLYRKIIYSRRKAEPSEILNIKRLYQVLLTRRQQP